MPPQRSQTSKQLIRFLIVLAAVMTGCKGSPSFPWDNLHGYTDKPIVIGHGLGDIEVQKTTLGEAKAILGDKFTREDSEGSFGSRCVDGVCDNNWRKFTDIRLDYSDYGIMLGFRSVEDEHIADNDLKLRFIYITCAKKWRGCAFTGKTAEGIHLGSTRKEVVAALGRSDTWTGQEGLICKRAGINIRFKSEYLRISDDDTVESFEIFSPLNFNEFEHRSI